jgi:hypothetical protein
VICHQWTISFEQARNKRDDSIHTLKGVGFFDHYEKETWSRNHKLHGQEVRTVICV